MIRYVRIDYDKPDPPGIFVIRTNSKGKISGENAYLNHRQMKHGAGVTKKVVKCSGNDHDYESRKPLDKDGREPATAD